MKRHVLALAMLGIGILVSGVVLLSLLSIILATRPGNTLAHDTFLRSLREPLRSLMHLTDPFYRAPAPETPLPHYILSVSREHLQEIENALPTETPGHLTDEAKVWVPGVFEAEGEKYPVKIRVRGLGHNHWRFAKKSWRVKFAKDSLFRGMREITLIIPEDREWTGEMLNVYRAAKLGLPHPPARFVTVELNRSKPMLYFEVEHWGKPMLEKLALPGDADLYKSNTAPPKFQLAYGGSEHPAFWEKYESAISSVDSSEALALFLALSEKDAHLDPEFEQLVETLFDIDQLAAWYALSLLSGNHHGHIGNVRLYLDPSRGVMIPFPWDISFTYPQHLDPIIGNAFWQEVFSVEKYRERAYEILRSYLSDEQNIENDLSFVSAVRRQIESAAYRDPYKVPTNREVRAALNELERKLQSNIDFLSEELN